MMRDLVPVVFVVAGLFAPVSNAQEVMSRSGPADLDQTVRYFLTTI